MQSLGYSYQKPSGYGEHQPDKENRITNRQYIRYKRNGGIPGSEAGYLLS